MSNAVFGAGKKAYDEVAAGGGPCGDVHGVCGTLEHGSLRLPAVTGRARVLMVLLIVLLFGIGGRVVLMSASDTTEPTPEPSPSGSVPWTEPGSGNALALRQVLFQESGQTLTKPALAPGPDSGGPKASARLLRTDCDLAPRPAKPDDLIIACDAPGFRYGLGPSELPG